MDVSRCWCVQINEIFTGGSKSWRSIAATGGGASWSGFWGWRRTTSSRTVVRYGSSGLFGKCTPHIILLFNEHAGFITPCAHAQQGVKWSSLSVVCHVHVCTVRLPVLSRVSSSSSSSSFFHCFFHYSWLCSNPHFSLCTCTYFILYIMSIYVCIYVPVWGNISPPFHLASSSLSHLSLMTSWYSYCCCWSCISSWRASPEG